MACDLKSLLTEACANDFVQLATTDPKLAKAVALQLLCNISQNGGGGGSGSLLTSNDLNPNTAGIVPSSLNSGAIWYQDPAGGTGSNVWLWSKTNQNWSQFSV